MPIQQPLPEFRAGVKPAVTPQSTTKLPGSTMEAAGGLLSEQYRPTTQGPVVRDIQSEDTASGQMSKIMDSQSDLMRDARRRAKGDMSSRGLLNTSMTAGAVQGGMMDAAQQLATHDASTYLKQGLENQAARNQEIQNQNAYNRDLSAGQFETDMGEYVSDATLERDLTKDRYGTTQDIRLDDAQSGNRIRVNDATSLNRLNESLQDYMEGLGSQELEGWINSGAEEAIRKSALDGEYIDSYEAIMTNADMTNAEKQTRLNQLDKLFGDLYKGMGIDFGYMKDYSTGYLAVTEAVMRSPTGGGDQSSF